MEVDCQCRVDCGEFCYWCQPERFLDGYPFSRSYVACSGCGLRNYATTDPMLNCPDFPKCAEEGHNP